MKPWNFARRCLRRALLAGLVLACLMGGMHAGDLDSLRGEQVGWARLKTANPWWRTHATTDPKLMRFFRQQTTLNIDPTWYIADVEDLRAMCAYPLLFSQSISMVSSSSGHANLAEYLQRGGFLLIDACINPWARGEPREYIAEQERVLRECLPDVRFAALPNEHEIYRCFFKFSGGPPHTEDHQGWGDYGLYGVYLGTRMAGVISTSGLQCGWAGMKTVQGHDTLCMKMLVNIYLYAMMQGGSGPS